MVIQPKVRGFICTTAHPQGCYEHVLEQIRYIKQQKPLSQGPKKVLVIGASTGYGLASRIAAAFGANAQTIGVFFEREADGKRTATAGWYNTAAFEQEALKAGLYAKSINGDAFSDSVKQQTIDLIKKDWQGNVDLVVYSLASPRRTHPKTGESFSSVLKPIGQTYTNKTVNVMTGTVEPISIEPAVEEDIRQTVAVMGGEDWEMWIDALLKAKLLANNFSTVAYSYIGPTLTYPIYREGTIGRAKADLDATARKLSNQLKSIDGHAYISVNKALVTQSSAAIPVVPLYISLLYKVMKDKKLHEGCIEQMWRLLAEKLYTADKVTTDQQGLIRLDDKEMQNDIQDKVSQSWDQVNSDNILKLSDLEGYREEFYKLFGFSFKQVNYDQDVDPAVDIPSIPKTTELA